MKKRLSQRALYGVVVGGLFLYLLFGWFVLVSPKRAEAARLDAEIATTEVAVAAARLAATSTAAGPDDTQQIAFADMFRLAKAMPNVPDMAGILLELSRIAEETGIEFTSITPQPSTAVGTFQEVPILLVFDGSFYELSDFLFRLRTLVSVRSGALHVSGRLFAVDGIAFAESPLGFPSLTATLTVTAYVFGTETAASDVPATPATTPPAAEAPVPEPNETESAVAAEGSS